MNSTVKPLILVIDNNHDQLRLMERLLTSNGYNVICADSGLKGLEIVKTNKPDLILLDVMMPRMDGYEVCSRLQKNSETAYIPVIFITALGEEQDKARAFSVGAVDYLVKPIQKEILIHKARTHLKTNTQWKELHKDAVPSEEGMQPSYFLQFKEFLFDQLDLESEKRVKFSAISPSQIYLIVRYLGITNSQMAKYIADFLKLPYISQINPYDVQLGVLPIPFCRTNLVVALSDGGEGNTFALSNPFNLELLDSLNKLTGKDQTFKLTITEPEHIELLFKYGADLGGETPAKRVAIAEDTQKIEGPTSELIKQMSKKEIEKHPIVYIANTMINKAVLERASDIHIEPKETETVVRFRIDGDLRDSFALKKNTGVKLISRLKVLGGLDLAEKRKPQDGSFAATINNKTFKLRLATTSTPNGESLIIRLLEPSAKPKDLKELGMADKQVNTMIDFAKRTHGVILIVGPTGSGKTTTIYSFLFHIDCKTRSLISAEDPVEYYIPFANQQQVNEKAGVTFESLLKSAVRQDPDILFLGEIRDQYSAKMAMDFASTGHLTVTTLHTSNATTAIFRLERLGIDRGTMADPLIGVVAQRLLKRLCPHCKKIIQISQEEIDMISPFTDEIPSQVAHPVGCPKCNNTGYHGREGIYEIIKFDPEISEMVRSGVPISEIRNFIRDRGDFLVSYHAVEKVKELLFSPKDVYETVLVEELAFEQKRPKKEDHRMPVTEKKIKDKISILVVEDDKDSQRLIARFLENHGYTVVLAEDGIDALLQLGRHKFDLIISDVNMPNLDGFKLLEMKSQKGIEAPVIFLTSRTDPEDAKRGLELGAMDYIKKPTQKDILLLRVKNALENCNKGEDKGG
ncbi:MAG: Flp pilus assembly complex ATPase component TadA [Deltaproteobacteria bacterium]|nr:Flp pilus assembly complex ATPase component TadA [Deltaproteobacteria bacterium]